MRKILAFIFSIIHYSIFIVLLLVFHVFQVIAYNVFGKKAHKIIVDILNLLLILNLRTLLCRTSFKGFKNLPNDKPLIVISNHQSMYDIPAIVWGFRRHKIRFISKKSLGNKIPSISYNLKKGGSVLIEREKGSDSIRKILELGKTMEENNYSVCLFPEGTRTKTGKMRKFQSAGFKTLCKTAPNALIVPLVINGNYKLHILGGMFPLNIGIHLKYTALEPIEQGKLTSDEILSIAEKKIIEKLP